MILVDACNINVVKKTLDQLNDLATRACQKMPSMPIENLYTGYSIFRINPKNLLIQFKEFDEGANLIRQASYVYDALGRRIEKVVTDLQISQNNKTRRYVYDGEDILKVFDENNQVLSKYTHSSLRLDDALAIDDKANNRSYYFLKDHLGSIVDIVSEDNSVVQHYAYSAFGKILKISDGSGNDISASPVVEPYFTYAGREWDAESGLYFNRARYYSPDLGRFISVDPHPGNMKSPITVVNKYIYGGNNPVMNVDPNGKFFFTAILVGAIIGSTAGFAAGAQASAVLGTGFWGTVGSTAITYGVGALAGAGAGLIAGAATGAVFNQLSGRGSFRDGLESGGQIGYLSGAIGGVAGVGTGYFLSETPGTIGAFAANNPYLLAGPAAVVPFTGEFKASCGEPGIGLLFGSKGCN